MGKRTAVLVVLSLCGALVGAAPSPVWAADPAPPAPAPYERIVPAAPDPNWSAVAITRVCMDLTSGKNEEKLRERLASCWTADVMNVVEGTLEFCKAPLKFDAKFPRPPTAKLLAVPDLDCKSDPNEKSIRPMNTKGLVAGMIGPEIQDAIIRGLAAFLVDRAKAEALASLAQRLQSSICDDDDGWGAKLLPLTCALIGAADPYAVPVSWGAVKATAEKDLHELPLRLLALELPRNAGGDWKDLPELIYVGVDLAQQVLLEQADPVELLVGLRTRYQDSGGHCQKRPAGCALLLAGISTEIVAQGLDPQNVKQEHLVPIAARLIVEQAHNHRLMAWEAKTLAEWAPRARDAAKRTLNALRAATRASKAAVAAAGAIPGNVSANEIPLFELERIGEHARAISDLLVVTLPALAPPLGVGADKVDRVVRSVSAVGQFVVGARKGDYLTAAIAAVQVFDIVTADGAPAWFKRYLPILGELAQAEDPEQVEKILHAVAAPVGSWRGKRGHGNLRVAVNGYLGAAGGWEWLGGTGVPSARSFQAGLFAPVGIEASMGIWKSSSIGLFLSVFDLGGVVNVRSSGETVMRGSGLEQVTVDQEPRIGFAQVFSPGLDVVWGVPGWPFVVGAGASLTPKLRRVTFVGTQTTEDVTALRVAVFLAADVTILPF